MIQGQLKASIGQCSAPVRDISEVERMQEQLKNSIRHLDQRLDTLADRLAPVRAAVPCGECCDAESSYPSSPLGSSLHADRLAVDALIARVSNLLDELAL